MSAFWKLLFAELISHLICPIVGVSQSHLLLLVKWNTTSMWRLPSLIDNIEAFDREALNCLLKELVEWVPTSATKPLGIVLVSDKVCVLCKRELVTGKDRPSYITVYDIQIGPTPGTHFHKICPSMVCCTMVTIPLEDLSHNLLWFRLGHECLLRFNISHRILHESN